jgi:hypothetical protein
MSMLVKVYLKPSEAALQKCEDIYNAFLGFNFEVQLPEAR